MWCATDKNQTPAMHLSVHCLTTAVVSQWELLPAWAPTCTVFMFIFISIKAPRIQTSFMYLWLNNFLYHYPGKKMSVYFFHATFPISWEDMITALDTNWLGQCRTAILCWLGRLQQVTLCNIAPNTPHFPFSFNLRINILSHFFSIKKHFNMVSCKRQDGLAHFPIINENLIY